MQSINYQDAIANGADPKILMSFIRSTGAGVSNYKEPSATDYLQTAREQTEAEKMMEYSKRNQAYAPAFIPILHQVSKAYPQIPDTAETVVRAIPNAIGSAVGLPEDKNLVSSFLGNTARGILTTPEAVFAANQKILDAYQGKYTDLTPEEKTALQNSQTGLVMGLSSPLKGATDKAVHGYTITTGDGKIMRGLSKEDAADWSAMLQDQGKKYSLIYDEPNATQLSQLKAARDAGDISTERAITDRIRTTTRNGQTAGKSILQISEEGGGWKPGREQEFNTALFHKDKATIEQLLPEVPAQYKAKFANEINAVLNEAPKLKMLPGETFGQYQLRTQAAAGKQLLTEYDLAQKNKDIIAAGNIARKIVASTEPVYGPYKGYFEKLLNGTN